MAVVLLCMVLCATAVVVALWGRWLFTPRVWLAIERVPWFGLRAQILSFLNPEWSVYQRPFEPGDHPPDNPLLMAMADTGPYAGRLLRPYLQSQDPLVRLAAAHKLDFLRNYPRMVGDRGVGDLDQACQSVLGDQELAGEIEQVFVGLLLDAKKPGASLLQAGLGLDAACELVFSFNDDATKDYAVLSFDYVVSCLPRQDRLGMRARLVFHSIMLDMFGDESELALEVWHRFSDLKDPAYAEVAVKWCVRNRAAIVGKLTEGRAE